MDHADSLSRLNPKYCEPLEYMAIVALKGDSEMKGVLLNIERELPLTLEEIKVKSETDNFIKKLNGQVRFKKVNRADLPRCNYYSICDGILMYAECVVIPSSLQEESLIRSFVF